MVDVRIVQAGANALLISIPAAWCRENDVHAGDKMAWEKDAVGNLTLRKSTEN
jgi:hypothetical protein